MNEKSLYAVIGDPVSHSLSPAMHNAAFRAAGKNAEYTAIHVTPDNLEAFFGEARKRLAGFNVTVPHKGGAFRYSDRLSEAAQLSGSVNTVKNDSDGVLSGDTTDGAGFERALREAFGFEPAGKDICLIGCGGVAHAIAWHCALTGTRSIRILNRTVEKAEALLEQIRDRFPEIICESGRPDDRGTAARFLASSHLAVQCTSLGLHEGDPLPAEPALFPEKILYFDTIYRRTPLLAALDGRGIPTQDGLLMLLHQGTKSYEIWFGEDAPVEVMREALLNAVGRR